MCWLKKHLEWSRARVISATVVGPKSGNAIEFDAGGPEYVHVGLIQDQLGTSRVISK